MPALPTGRRRPHRRTQTGIIAANGVELAYRTFDKVRHVDQGAIADNKQLGAVLAMIRDDSCAAGPSVAAGRADAIPRLFKVG